MGAAMCVWVVPPGPLTEAACLPSTDSEAGATYTRFGACLGSFDETLPGCSVGATPPLLAEQSSLRTAWAHPPTPSCSGYWPVLLSDGH